MEISTLDMVARLAVSIVLGSFVGMERALRDKPAGFRTNILICLGACVFTIASQALSGPVVDDTRIAAQIVSGVGFLGAGAILRDDKGIIGLTTAATIWAVSAIGMAAGFGQYILAVVATVGVVVVLVGLPLFSTVIEQRRDAVEYRLWTAKSAEQFDRVSGLFTEHKLRIVLSDSFEDDGGIVFTIKALGPRNMHETLHRKLILDENVKLCEAT